MSHNICETLVLKLCETITKEKLILCFSNRVAGKDIAMSEEMLRKMQLSDRSDAMDILNDLTIDFSEIDEVMAEIETELNGLINRVSGCENLESFTKEMEKLTNEVDTLNNQQRKMAVKLNEAVADLNKKSAEVATPLEEFGQEIKNSQASIGKEFTKRSMTVLSEISKFKASLDLPSVEELEIVEETLLEKRDHFQNLVDREHRVRRKCDDNPDFDQLVSGARALIDEWNLLQERMKRSKCRQ